MDIIIFMDTLLIIKFYLFTKSVHSLVLHVEIVGSLLVLLVETVGSLLVLLVDFVGSLLVNR